MPPPNLSDRGTGGNIKNWPDRAGSVPGRLGPALRSREGVPSVPEGMIERIGRHPHFPAAARESAKALVEAHARNRLLNRLVSDRGRAQFGILALYLHFHDEAGLTASRMADLAEEVGVCSRGRVKALLVLLRWAGHVAPVAGARDLRRRPLAPTERMQAAYRSRWRRQLELMAPIVPDAASVAAELDDPAVFGALAVALGGMIRSGFRLLDHCPAIAPIAERDNGLLVLLHLALAAPGPAPLAGSEPFAVSISSLARSVRVSRSHALNLLREAERQGLIAREAAPPGQAEGVVFCCRPLLAASLAGFFAAAYAAMGTAAASVTGRARPSLSG